MCEKCHVNEVAEWNANTNGSGAHSKYLAEYGEGCFCHQINTTRLEAYSLSGNNSNVSEFGFVTWRDMGNGLNNSSDWAWRPTTTPHAAVIIDCVDCHYNESQQIDNPDSAHYQFWNQTNSANNSDSNTDDNTACMACHTHTHLNITWLRLSGMTIVADHTDATADPYLAWNLTVNVTDTNTTYVNTTG